MVLPPTLNTQSTIAPKQSKWLLLCVLIFLCCNLRAPLTTIDPLIGLIEKDLHISKETAGLFALMPVGILGVASIFAPHIARYMSIWRMIFLFQLITIVGMIWRSYGGYVGMLGGTLVLGIGLGIIGSAIPGFVKSHFPRSAPRLIGAYSGLLGLSTAISAALALPIAQSTGSWRFSLVFWAIPLGLCAVLWFIYFTRNKVEKSAPPVKTDMKVVLRNSTAQTITLFYILRVSGAYFCITWITLLLKNRGLEADQAGLVLSILSISQVPASFFAHWIAIKLGSGFRLVFWSALLSSGALWGIMYLPFYFCIPFGIIIGLGIGAIAARGMTLMVVKTQDPVSALSLSGMVQGVGFLGGAGLALGLSKLIDQTSNFWIYCSLYLLINIMITYFAYRCDRSEPIPLSTSPSA